GWVKRAKSNSFSHRQAPPPATTHQPAGNHGASALRRSVPDVVSTLVASRRATFAIQIAGHTLLATNSAGVSCPD
ncbi:MAG: hypothetical protein ACRDKE_05120, partial [Solirubrobacterales bacterium]